LSVQQLLELDKAHIWHPYSSINSPITNVPVKHAQGCRLQLFDGRSLIDGMASWWSVIHGYNHPQINAAAKTQLDNFSHVMFGGLTHEPAVLLAQKLIQLSPEGLDKVFFSDSGSVAVEVAMKMALQYWQARKQAGRKRFLSLRNAYHGDTFAAMSVCDPITGMHHLFKNNLQKQIFSERPGCKFSEACADSQLEDIANKIRNHKDELAAVILEPIVQGAGGMYFYSADYLRGVSELCQQHEVLLIADEIATGFGRSGKLFACEHAAISPDIMCVGKALSGGYLSFAATLCSNHIAETICQSNPGVFMHGPTFMANPLACAIANASIDLLIQNNWQAQVENIQIQLTKGLQGARNFSGVADVRVLGAIGVIELDEAVNMEVIQPMFVDRGVWLRPFGKLVYMMPPYTIKNNEIDLLCAATLEVLRHYLNSL